MGRRDTPTLFSAEPWKPRRQLHDHHLAQVADADALPDIEQSEGDAYREVAELAWIADDENQTVERHRELIAKGTCWVAVEQDGRTVAFLSAEIQDDTLHIWELAARLDRQRSGIGRALLEKAITDARERRLVAITLTTFRDVIWNAPFYPKLGFQVLGETHAGDRLRQILRREIEHGMPASRRCAMRLILG
ncbi:GNAT family N-acetyltransferase [Mesorhizobium sp. M7A.F.Ca.AU.002.06.1.1]|nr:GNAT family N-acetyltransferase [Mesorhizobium sp. Primo-B]RUU34912.1 GNAT family N-acetyltransferase [Mesorhizobium sp. Primo-A]RVB83454.1 GNAT family N-acetyltransferase [Mesorhizobium sp. M7A.F.Ca.AU.002.04.1.1]RVB89049.1 GNAT family N-acetyltransferase [Mesorhizobium sp. M7A.F.Ca.AU.002.03.1.1]RVC03189.1 GNAT family N-acetyltransferase [Mesorhizobium sp. M7A.F.Ca.AU.002.06.1.1]RVC17545.1 GNAT family N-acetyltransferase [Mesorhizobium sp. M7A.F.Ca.AU.001.01.1.1]RVC20009.1 GNAT family N-